MICHKCTYFIRSKELCAVDEAPDINGECGHFDHDGSKEPVEAVLGNDQTSQNPVKIQSETSTESDPPGGDQKTKKGGVDLRKLKEIYLEGNTFKYMATQLDIKEGSISYHLNKLRATGELTKADEASRDKVRQNKKKRDFKPPTKQPTSETPVIIGSPPASASIKDLEPQEVQALDDKQDDIIADNEACLQTIKGLMTGADKTVIYRDGMKITIEPDKGE